MKPTPRIFASVVLALASMAAHAQTHPGSSPVIPTAPKRSFAPASFSALPELQCKLYPEGGTASKGLTVFTDDDGYARFHAVRATASDVVQRLALDCRNSTGKPYSYSVDLTSADTFAPHPLNLRNERGTERPALKGDPLGYSRLELIQAGYGLRPDPTDTAAYARWLEAATTPGWMLEQKRPKPFSATVSTGTGAPWTGSVMTGAPNYVSTEATFNVPTAVPLGDETGGGTSVAIWNGLGGNGTGSGLIQGGAGIQTTGLTAVYSTWREYCCGDADSDGYGGAFIPNPGDKIYSIEWYCNDSGDVDLKGGYGCTYLNDVTTGAILSCTLPGGSPCWSVKALPLCSVNPKATQCMTIGLAAEFIIENTTPQLAPDWSNATTYTPGQIVDYGDEPYICLATNTNEEPPSNPTLWAFYPPLTAFTDFTPLVTMSGSAYSTTTGAYSQTVTTDPAVEKLEDFTNTTSHINITLGKTDQTYFTSSQFKRVSGLTNNSATAESIGVGPNAKGSQVGDAWVLGATADSNGNYAIYRWINSNWVEQTGRANHIAVGPEGYPWVVNSEGKIYYWNGGEFELAPGNACASWIGVGYNNHGSIYGGPWILGCNEGSSGYNIYQLQGSTWVQQHGAATKLTMGPRGPWVINKSGAIYYWDVTAFVAGPAGCATSIGVGSLNAPFAGPFGDVWITGCTLEGNDYDIYQLYFGSTWVQIPGLATQISVSPDLGVPWVVNSLGEIFE